MNKVDLGAVTAYAMAVAQGYEGTEEEFAALQANSGNNALRAENAADRAQQILDSIPLDFQEVSQGVATLTEEMKEVAQKALELKEAAPIEQGNGYTHYDPAADKVHGEITASDAFTYKKYKVEHGLPYFYSGVFRGSAHVIMACYYDADMNAIGFNGKYSSSEIETYENYAIDPPPEAVYVIFCAYGDLSIKRYGEKRCTQSSASMFIGHNDLPTFDTDYCQIIVYGQSLSVGADAKFVTDPVEDGCYALGSITVPSAELTPLQLTSGNQHPVVSAVNCLHGLLEKCSVKTPELIAGSYGAGGQSIAQLLSPYWQSEIKTEQGYDYDIDSSGKYLEFRNSLDVAKSVADANGKTISCPVIVFMQGERDYYSDESLSTQAGSTVHAYACGGDKERYKLYMQRLKTDMQNACMNVYGQSSKPLFAIYQCSGWFVKDHTMSINMAQVEFAQENDDVILLPSPYFTPNYDLSHLATNGYRWYGEFIAKAVFQTLVQRSEYRPMQISGAIVDGKKIRVKICNAVLPVVFDNYTVEQVTGYGFAIWADDVRISPHKITIYGDEIIIHTDTDMTNAAKVELSYGGMDNNGSGNIRDSSPYKAKYAYWDDSADKGQSNTLTITHRPTDKDGNSIVGKKYPMWNWLASWYGVIN